MDIIKWHLRDNIPIIKYFAYSVIVSLVDTGIVWSLIRFSTLHLIAANTIGVVSGFVLHYILASKSVFSTEYGPIGFIIYLATFLLGLIFANWLIFMSYQYLFISCTINLRILLSKGVSVAVPFFAMYYIRKHLFAILNKRGK